MLPFARYDIATRRWARSIRTTKVRKMRRKPDNTRSARAKQKAKDKKTQAKLNRASLVNIVVT